MKTLQLEGERRMDGYEKGWGDRVRVGWRVREEGLRMKAKEGGI